MSGKKSKKPKKQYPVDVSLLGRKFVVAVALGLADFREKYHGQMLSDSTIYEMFGAMGEVKDREKWGFFVGFMLGVHENPLRYLTPPSDTRPFYLDQRGPLDCPTDAFVRRYNDGKAVFIEQCQEMCETGWDLADRLLVLTRRQCVRKFITDSKNLYHIGKATGWWLAFAKQSALYEELTRGAMVEMA